MIYPFKADIVGFLEHLTITLRPYASSKNIRLNFHSNIEKECIYYNPSELITAISNMICEIINFIPYGENIVITLTKGEEYLELQIQNTGLDLSHNEEVKHNSLLNFSVSRLPAGTIFSYKFFKKE